MMRGPRSELHKNTEGFDPAKWHQYFTIKDDIEIDTGIFRIYRLGVEGPLLYFIHGGGFSALTWAVLSKLITDEACCQCLAVDMRGHGDTVCSNERDYSIEVLCSDMTKIIFAMFPTEAPPIILVGHSMGGAVAIHLAHSRAIPSVVGLVVIDVVEGSALQALRGMTSFLRTRPQGFQSLQHAIEWCIKTGQIRNVESARVSLPGQLKIIATGATATYELEQIDAFSIKKRRSLKSNTEILDISESSLDIQKKEPVGPNYPEIGTYTVFEQMEGNNQIKSTRNKYEWRINLIETEKYWRGWFENLSTLFLAIPEPKLLLLAGMDRLDKKLTIGQMQGKFQLHIFPQAGHAVHEDVPDKVSSCIAAFLVRNRFSAARTNT